MLCETNIAVIDLYSVDDIDVDKIFQKLNFPSILKKSYKTNSYEIQKDCVKASADSYDFEESLINLKSFLEYKNIN